MDYEDETDEDRRYGLKPLPKVPFIGREESERRNAAYQAARKAYRKLHPHREKVDE